MHNAKNISISFHSYSGTDTCVKMKCTQKECAAVQKHWNNFIAMNTIPVKMEVEWERDWRTVTFYFENRIAARICKKFS